MGYSQNLADQDPNLQYMSTNEYIAKLQDYNGKVHAAHNAGYLLTGAGAALTIVGIPLYCYGKRIMTMEVNYTGNGEKCRQRPFLRVIFSSSIGKMPILADFFTISVEHAGTCPVG